MSSSYGLLILPGIRVIFRDSRPRAVVNDRKREKTRGQLIARNG